MTTSTFSLLISPAPGRRDVRHVRNPERRVALHGAVDHVDRIGAQEEIHEACRRALPALDLALAHGIDEIVLLARVKLGEAAPGTARLGGAVYGAQRRAIEVRERRSHIHDAGF